MITALEILLYVLCLLVINSFFIYPLAVFLMSRKNTGRITVHGFEPTISILIAAYNEEKVIEDRIENIASMNYDREKVEVLIGSDMSTDGTNQILFDAQKKYPWLKVYIAESRRGKAGILNDLIKQAKNEIVVFTDANTEFHVDALKNLSEDFADKNVGGVCGRLVLVDNDSIRSEGVEETKYWQYETLIKRAEGKSGILLAANGGIFAIRKELYKDIPIVNAVTDDLFISLSVVAQEFKFTYREDAIGYESTGKDLNSEYKRKVRFGSTNFQTLVYFKNLLTGKNKKVAYAFLSHKVTRWFLPALLASIFILSFVLSDYVSFVQKLFMLQTAFYLLAFCGYLLSLVRIRITIFSIPYFFVVSNVAIVEGFIKYINKKHSVIWDSTER
jgi:cellulose synthase/poly-beta-1,6-N-acetylglucosamine synthase-like glycosyltransferase